MFVSIMSFSSVSSHTVFDNCPLSILQTFALNYKMSILVVRKNCIFLAVLVMVIQINKKYISTYHGSITCLVISVVP